MRCGIVAFAGRPNVGKSTLVNALCGTHVSIVSDKPQTTRRRIVGIIDDADSQVVLLDLPGFQRPRDDLTRRMQRSVDETLVDIDCCLLVLDATMQLGAGDRFVANRVYANGASVVVALTKCDLTRPVRIAEAIEAAAALGPFHALHPVSGLTGDGVAALRTELQGMMPPGQALYPAGSASGEPLRLRVAELVREQALARTRQEVPHAFAVVVDEYQPATRHHAAHLRVRILTDTASQKRILVGRAGAMVRAIGTSARPGIEALIGAQVMLDLRVDTHRDWRNDPRLLDQLGP